MDSMSLTRVFFCRVSSSAGYNRDWDRSPFTGPSEGAVQRLFHQWHAMSSASEDTGRLSSSPSSSTSSSGWLRSSVPDSATDGQTCSLKESAFPAFEVKNLLPVPVGTTPAHVMKVLFCGSGSPGELLGVSCRPHRLLLPGGGGAAVHRTAPEVGWTYPPHERRQLKDTVQVSPKCPRSGPPSWTLPGSVVVRLMTKSKDQVMPDSAALSPSPSSSS